jgi:hypothetical protein
MEMHDTMQQVCQFFHQQQKVQLCTGAFKLAVSFFHEKSEAGNMALGSASHP